jgi:hypothetical protein
MKQTSVALCLAALKAQLKAQPLAQALLERSVMLKKVCLALIFKKRMHMVDQYFALRFTKFCFKKDKIYKVFCKVLKKVFENH